MIFIHNDTCSKCAGLAEELSREGYAWETVRYMDGELTEELVRTILRDYDGPRSDLIRSGEPEWLAGGFDANAIDETTLTQFILSHPVVLQRPIVLVDGRIVVARPPDVLWSLLTQ